METKKNVEESKKITIADVAEALGVSKTTVSRAISGKGRIGEETRRRVMEYIEVNGYKPNVIAKGLAQSKTYNIAMLLPSDCGLEELPFFQDCMVGVCETASEREYDVLVVYGSGRQTKKLERILFNHKIDGILLTGTYKWEEAEKLIKEYGIPAVAIGASVDETTVQVVHDHRRACCELTKNLLAEGARTIGLIGGNNLHVITKSCYQGFSDAFHDMGALWKPELIYLDVESAQTIDGIVDEMLQKGTDCIICMNDIICGRVLQQLQKERIKVPGQIKVASFYQSLLKKHIPKVTTLEFDAKALGVSACNILLDMIEGKQVKKKSVLPYKICIKETTK